jgi:hypothetical protein
MSMLREQVSTMNKRFFHTSGVDGVALIAGLFPKQEHGLRSGGYLRSREK